MNKLIPFALVLLFFIAGIENAWSQNPEEITLHGVIIDEYDEPIPGATVMVYRKGELIAGAFTNENGEFRISTNQDFTSIMIRYIGYQEIEITDDHPAWMAMREGRGYEFQMEVVGSIWPPYDDFELETQDILGTATFEEKLIERNDVANQSGSHPDAILNSIPGVRFDSRGYGGSRRLSIRGSLLRSSYGVRNVKVYLDGAPLTLADGSTPLELLDIELLDGLSAVKGPSGTRFGAGTGGALMATSRAGKISQYSQGAGVEFRQTLGSYGLSKTLVGARLRIKRGPMVQVSYVRQRLDGYRAQEGNQRDAVWLTISQKRQRHDFLATAWYQQANWDLPGALDSLQAFSNPRQAAAFAEAADAHVAKTHVGGLLRHRISLADDRLIGTTALSVQGIDKSNPYALSPSLDGFKSEELTALGARSNWMLQMPDRENIYLRWGVEANWLQQDYVESDSAEAAAGVLLNSLLNRQWEAHGFLKGSYTYRRHQFSIGVGVNHSRVISQDRLPAQLATAGRIYKLRVLPEAEWQFDLTTDYLPPVLFARISSGYSPPTFWEMRQADRSFSPDLEAEDAWNAEVGVRSRILQGRLQAEGRIYGTMIQNAILPEVLPSGETQFFNAGEVYLQGVEATIAAPSLRPLRRDTWLGFFASGSYQRYRFGLYEINGEEFQGNQVPGIPALQTSQSAEIHVLKARTHLMVTAREFSSVFLDNANTVSQPAYLLLDANLRFHFRLRRGRWFRKSIGAPSPTLRVIVDQNPPFLEFFGGAYNLLNTWYNSFPNLNAFGGRYYNPGPGRNFYAGIRFYY